MRVLFVVPYVPSLVRTRPYNLIKTLTKRGNDVILATLRSSQQEDLQLDQLTEMVSEVVSERMALRRSAWNCLKLLPSQAPLQSAYSWNPRLAKKLVNLVRSRGVDVIHVEHLRGVKYALEIQRLQADEREPVPIIWDSVDCISYLFRQAVRDSVSLRSRMMTRLELRRTERYEASLIRQLEKVLVTSEADQNEFLRLALTGKTQESKKTDFASRICVLKNGVDLDYFKPSDDRRHDSAIVITGKMSYHANVSAVVSFVKEVMPSIWARKPDVQVWIVGKGPPEEVLRLGVPWTESVNGTDKRPRCRVLVTGEVSDIRPFLWQATLAVAPIKYGAGIQNKVLEAMACGTPVVATPQAVCALEARSGRDLAVAGSKDGLVTEILELLEDSGKRKAIGSAGRSFVEACHDWDLIGAQLENIYLEARDRFAKHTGEEG